MTTEAHGIWHRRNGEPAGAEGADARRRGLEPGEADEGLFHLLAFFFIGRLEINPYHALTVNWIKNLRVLFPDKTSLLFNIKYPDHV